jgi:hypothetical protein
MRCAIKIILAFAGILGSHAQRVSAQDPASAEPSAVVRTAFLAYEARRWNEFAALVHPDALTEFRSQQLTMAEMWEAHSTELNEARQRSKTDPGLGNPILRLFAGVKTLAELRALSQQAFLARYLEARSPKANPRDPDYQPPTATRDIIGDVPETQDLVHVVYRVRTDVARYGRTESIEVIPVKRAASGWELMLNPELSYSGSMTMTVNDVTKE